MGRQIILTIVWFQFIVSQILAIIMLSSSVSDEIRAGTLNVLMTTPVSSFQIIVGKLLSKLLQIFLLLVISMPLLAIIRVFGGMPWYYVVSSFFITLTAVIFSGSLSLFLSIYFRQAYSVILILLGLYLLIFGIIQLTLGLSQKIYPRAKIYLKSRSEAKKGIEIPMIILAIIILIIGIGGSIISIIPVV